MSSRTAGRAGVGRDMKFRVAREVLADAVAWTARSLPPRPSVPVLAGILLEVEGSQLSVSGFDYEVSARAEVDVQSTESGRVLVPGRLLAEITRSLPDRPVEIATDGSKAVLTCGSATFTLLTMPPEDYPSLPEMPPSAGSVGSDAFAAAVAQVAIAAGRRPRIRSSLRRGRGPLRRCRPAHCPPEARARWTPQHPMSATARCQPGSGPVPAPPR